MELAGLEPASLNQLRTPLRCAGPRRQHAIRVAIRVPQREQPPYKGMRPFEVSDLDEVSDLEPGSMNRRRFGAFPIKLQPPIAQLTNP